MKISIIVAKARNNVIGKDNQLVWKLSGDLQHFKKTTLGHHIIMGRKTFESMGKPLPGRTSIVITRNNDYQVPDGHYVVHSLDAALDLVRSKSLEQVYVLGGAEIFKMALPIADELIITEVDASPEGDTFFPPVDYSQWEKVSEEKYSKDEKNEFNYTFVIYKNPSLEMTNMEKISISNDRIKASFNLLGAELSSIRYNGKEYIWQADPAIWNRHSPVLFPNVGSLLDNTYYVDGKPYHLPQHGFARNSEFVLVEQTDSSVKFLLESDQETLKVYPYPFKLFITYILHERSLQVIFEVENPSNETVLFSIGGHPAFNCPLDPSGEAFEDYVIDFHDGSTEKELYQLEGTSLAPDKYPLRLDKGKLDLKYSLFEHDALIFDSKNPFSVTVKSKRSGAGFSVKYEQFKWLGIWTKGQGAGFLCLEPWNGIADQLGHNPVFQDKLGINRLASGETSQAQYSMEFF